MIILDTNVLSEVLSKAPNERVIAWLNSRHRADLWITTITVFEIRLGIDLLKPGHKRDRLEVAFEGAIGGFLAGQIFEFDHAAAIEAAGLFARRQENGRPAGVLDTLIAGVAISRRATIATRNTRHFVDLPVPILDPWEG